MDPILEEVTTTTPGPPAAIETVLARSSSVRRIFFGPFGLRAGWSLLIYFALLVSIVLSIRAIASHLKASRQHTAAAASTAATPSAQSNVPPQSVKPAAQSTTAANAPLPSVIFFLNDAILFSVFFLLSWLMAFIERRRITVFGLGGHGPVRRFLFGTFWGFASLSLLVGTLYALHLLSFDATLLHGFAALRWGATLLVGFLLLGCFEEYSFRGYFQFTLTRGLVGLGNRISSRHARAIAFVIASTIISALFLYGHSFNSGEDKVGLAVVFCASLTFLVALWRTGSLWWAIGFHMAWDWSQSFLYGVPDSGAIFQGRLFATHALGNPVLSGGTVGPEGSILAIPTLALMILVLCFTHPSPQPPLETLPPKMHKPDEAATVISENRQLLNANC